MSVASRRVRVTSFACLALLAALAAPARADVPTCDPPVAGPPLQWCVPANTTKNVAFNATLDPALEPGFGTAATRQAAFLQAIADWNGALAAVGATFRLGAALANNVWAVDQGVVLCTDPALGLPTVYADVTAPYLGDGINAASTGNNPGGAHVDMNNLPIGAGWIVPSAFAVPDTNGGVLELDKTLAITTSKLDNANPGCIVEADIAWYTHYGYQPPVGPAVCVRTPWDFDYPLGPAAGRYDFYTVILHELGHLLGVPHQAADAAGTNVMQAFLPTQTRRMIGQKELMCLCARYGPAGANCAVTPVHQPTWGQLKSHYR